MSQARTRAQCWLWLRATNSSIPELPDEIAGLERTIDIPALAVPIPLEEIYRGIVHQDQPDE